MLSYELEIVTNSGHFMCHCSLPPIADTVTYINVLSTYVTIVFSWVLRKTGDTHFIHEWVYFGDGALVTFI